MGIAKLYSQSRGNGFKINGIIEDYYAYAGENISAGDFVEFVNGVASKTYIGTSEETQLDSPQNSTPIKAVALSENKIFIAHQHWITSGTYYLRGIVCIIDGVTITHGSDTTLLKSTSNRFDNIACSALDENRVFISHSGLSNNYLRALVCTVSGTTITAGTDTDLSTNSGSGYSVMTQLIDTDKIFIAHCWYNGYNASYTICTISGTVITKETTGEISAGANQTQYSVINIIPLENKDLLIIYSKTVSSSYYICGNVCSVSGTTVTKGTETQLSNIAWSSYSISSVLLENNNVFIAHSNANSNSSLYGLVCKISGTTITAGTSTQLSTGTNSGNLKSSISIDGNKALIVYSSDLILYGMVCTINGTAIVTGTAVELGTGNYNRNSISLVQMPLETIFIAHGGGTEGYLYGQIISIDKSNNIPTNQVEVTEYETQVRKATTSDIYGVAKTKGVGGDSTGHKDIVSIYTVEQTLAMLPVGTLVKDPSSTFLGEPVIWKIADVNHEGYPSNSVTLISDKILAMRAFDAKEPNNSDSGRKLYGNNRYSVSNIRQWLNSDAGAGQWYSAQHSADTLPNSDNVSVNPYDTKAGFLNGFSQKFKNALLETTITSMLNTTADGGESEIVADKIFLPSDTEVGLGNSITEGATLPIFSDNASRYAYCTTKALEDSEYENDPVDENTACSWRLRTPFTAGSSYDGSHISVVLSTTGALGYGYAYIGSIGIRPLCNLASSIKVSKDEDGIYKLDF